MKLVKMGIRTNQVTTSNGQVIKEVQLFNGEYYVGGRRVDPGVFSSPVEYTERRPIGQSVLPRLLATRAIISMDKISPKFIKKINGYIVVGLQRIVASEGSLNNDDWVELQNHFGISLVYCNYRIIRKNSALLKIYISLEIYCKLLPYNKVQL